MLNNQKKKIKEFLGVFQNSLKLKNNVYEGVKENYSQFRNNINKFSS